MAQEKQKAQGNTSMMARSACTKTLVCNTPCTYVKLSMACSEIHTYIEQEVVLLIYTQGNWLQSFLITNINSHK